MEQVTFDASKLTEQQFMLLWVLFGDVLFVGPNTALTATARVSGCEVDLAARLPEFFRVVEHQVALRARAMLEERAQDILDSLRKLDSAMEGLREYVDGEINRAVRDYLPEAITEEDCR